MSTSLFGLKPKDTYQALIKVGNNTSIDGTNKVLSDGLGNDLPIQASTSEINFTGVVKQSGTPIPTAAEVAAKQATLVSGTNIKTINGNSVLGSGNLVIGASAVWGAITGTLSDQTDLQSVLNTKVTGNVAITGATKTKLTYDSKGLVTAGADATTADIADSSNKRYVTDSQLIVIGNTSGTNTGDNSPNSLYAGLASSKQDTLVSGTNIKTINSVSVLGAGDVVVQATLVSGTNIKTINGTSILGSGDISISSSAAWGAITGTLSSQTDLQSALNAKQATLVSATNIKTINGSSVLGSGDLSVSASPSGVAGAIQFSNGSAFSSDATNLFWDDTNNRLGIGLNTPSHPLQVQGTGSTSATFAFRVQNNANTDFMRYRDDGVLQIYNSNTARTGTWDGYDLVVFRLGRAGQGQINLDGEFALRDETGSANLRIESTASRFVKGLGINTTGANVASAAFQVDGTTKGLLPPRMTTTQINAIVSPAEGLMVFNTTISHMCVYQGGAWAKLSHSPM